MTDHELEEAMGVCCGNSTGMMDHIHRTLQIMQTRRDSNTGKGSDKAWLEHTKTLADHLGGDTYSPMATVYLHFLDRLDLIEHGSGIAGSWLTAQGERVLEELNRRKPLDAIVEAADA